MSISYCNDCERIVEDNTHTVFLTEDYFAYEDGEFVTICGTCGGDGVVELSEDRPN